MLLTSAPRKTFPRLARPAERRRRRILLSANAVSPQRGSEPGVGWHLATRLAKYHDVTVLCAPEVPPAEQPFREEIHAYLRENGPIDGLAFEFVDLPRASFWLQRESLLMRRTLYYAGYRAWQKAAFQRAVRLHAQKPFELAHHLNITCFREPGYLWRLPVPFVWGPIGGAANLPPTFLPMMGWQERLYYRARNLGNLWQRRMSRRCQAAAKKARHIWAIGESEQHLARDTWGRTAHGLIETGTLPREGAIARDYEPTRPLRLIWSGQHIGRKALPILLHALATTSAGPRAQLTILGDGPERPRWMALADSLGLSGQIRWLGQVPHAQAIGEMSSADVLAFTSLQEGTPHVVLEAMSLGLPVVCHDACGMGQAVTGSSGIKIPLDDPATSIAGFRQAVERMSNEPRLVNNLSAGALQRATELTWDAKAQQIADVYDQVLDTAPARGGRA